MTKAKTYKVAGHHFRVEMEADSFIWERMEEAYGPFEVRELQNEDHVESIEDTGCLFSIKVHVGSEEIPVNWKENMDFVYSNKGTVEPGFVELSVYKSSERHCFEFTQPMSEIINGRFVIDGNWRNAELYVSGTDLQKWMTFTTGINFCFLLSTACHQTVLAHSSCVTYQGRAYLFLGKSGTGKSTHSGLWLKHIAGSELLNDDNPVVKVGEDGARVYGSPWSGKTPCYKNDSAPIGAFVQIKQKPENRIGWELPLQAFAVLLPSMSTMKWDERVYRGVCDSVGKLIEQVPLYTLGCRPDQEAAEVCHAKVTQR